MNETKTKKNWSHQEGHTKMLLIEGKYIEPEFGVICE
jgi:hypothetical protein